MLQVPMQPVKKGDWRTTTEWDWVTDIATAAVIMIPVEGGRELSARAIYLRKPKITI